MQKGIKNENDFTLLLDRKIVKNLSQNIQNLLFNLFDNIDDNSRIECWKSKYYEKADIKIRINNEIRGISLKTGHNCSMHQEKKESFYKFLLKIGVDNYIIDKFNDFMLGYVNGKRVSAEKYILHNLVEIKIIRDKFNEYYIKMNLINRFLFQGTETQKYSCDALILGTPKDFLWATKEEIIKYLLDYQIKKPNHINISALNIKCYDRNLRNNKERVNKQEEIQIKWYNIEKDLKNIVTARKK